MEEVLVMKSILGVGQGKTGSKQSDEQACPLEGSAVVTWSTIQQQKQERYQPGCKSRKT